MIDPTLLLWTLIVVAYVVLCYTIGRLAIDMLVPNPRPLVMAGAALVGATLLGLQLWVYGFPGIPWNAVTLLLPWLIVAVFRRRRVRALLGEEAGRLVRLSQTLSTLSPFELVLVTAGTIILLAYLVALVAKPVFAWDAIDAWLFKAKLFYHQQAVDLRVVAGDVQRSLDYPPMFPLLAASLYTLMGQAIDLLGKAVAFIFVVVAAASSLVALSQWVGRQLAILFTFVLLTIPLFGPVLVTGAYMGYADYPLAVCMMLSLLCFYDGERAGQPQAYAFTVVFAAMAALIKNEGLVFLAIVLMLLITHLTLTGRLRLGVRPDWRIVAICLASVAPVVAWRGYVALAGLNHAESQVNIGAALPLLPGRLSVILWYLSNVPNLSAVSTAVGLTPTTGADAPWLAAGWILSFILVAANRFRSGALVLAAIGLQLGSYFLVYLLTTMDELLYLDTTFDRLLVQLAPSVIVLLAIALHPYLGRDHQAISRRIAHQYAPSTAPPNRTMG